MRPWLIIIVLAFVSLFVVTGKPLTSTSINPSHAAQAATDSDHPHQLQIAAVSEPTLKTRMFDFFSAHPDPGVREELPKLIRVFQVRTNWGIKGVAAGFLRHIDHKTLKVHSVLAMSPELVETPNDPRAQLVVYHEFQHYLQWRDGTIPEETFLHIPWSDKDLPRICKQKWYAESGAYQKECAFGRANGLVDQLDPHEALAHVCAATEEQFVPVLKRMLKLGDPSAKACANVWDAI